MKNPNNFRGHVTLADGSHRALSPEEAERLWNEVEAAKSARAKAMPDERSALNQMMDAFVRLKEFGWNEAIYCPKDGSSFDVIEAGSTGIHRCHYSGKWPTGTWWIEDDNDLWPSRPILFRLDPEAAKAEKQRMAEAAARFRAALPADEPHGGE